MGSVTGRSPATRSRSTRELPRPGETWSSAGLTVPGTVKARGRIRAPSRVVTVPGTVKGRGSTRRVPYGQRDRAKPGHALALHAGTAKARRDLVERRPYGARHG